MIYYAVIDTNVLVSALLSSHADAATVQVVGRMLDGEIIIQVVPNSDQPIVRVSTKSVVGQ